MAGREAPARLAHLFTPKQEADLEKLPRHINKAEIEEGMQQSMIC